MSLASSETRVEVGQIRGCDTQPPRKSYRWRRIRLASWLELRVQDIIGLKVAHFPSFALPKLCYNSVGESIYNAYLFHLPRTLFRVALVNANGVSLVWVCLKDRLISCFR